METKLYAVEAEYLYGDDEDEKRAKQLSIVAELGLKETDQRAIGRGKRTVVCMAEEALALVSAGYCGSLLSADSFPVELHSFDWGLDVESLVRVAIEKTAESIGNLFNERCGQEQPSPSLMAVTTTMLEEDCCTDKLQERLDDGWRILAVCPQPKRRPDYVLGK